MNPAELLAMKHDLDTLRVNVSETFTRIADRLIDDGETGVGGALLVLERSSRKDFADVMGWFAQATAAADPPGTPARRGGERKRAPKGQGEHRHKYNERGVCGLLVNGALCGAPRQRTAKGSAKPAAAPPSPEARTVPIAFTGYGKGTPPPPDGDEDRFAGGAFGSSSTTERGR